MKVNLLSQYPELEPLISKETKVELIKPSKKLTIYMFGPLTFFECQGKLVPTLKTLNQHSINLPRICVDKGALIHVARGADLMVPGIIDVDSFDENEIVVITSCKENFSVAVGLSLMSSEEIIEASKGRAVRNIHHLNDEIWKQLCLIYMKGLVRYLFDVKLLFTGIFINL